MPHVFLPFDFLDRWMVEMRFLRWLTFTRWEEELKCNLLTDQLQKISSAQTWM